MWDGKGRVDAVYHAHFIKQYPHGRKKIDNHLGTLHFSKNHTSLDTVVHEVTHAAITSAIWGVINLDEDAAYAVGNMTAEFYRRIL